MKFFILLVFWGNLFAHQSSLAFLNMQIQEKQVKGNYKLAIEDALLLYNLDTNFDSKLQWKEVIGAQKELQTIIKSQLHFSSNSQVCNLDFEDVKLDYLHTNKYFHFDFLVECSKRVEILDIEYSLLFDKDSQHKMYFTLKDNENEYSSLFTQDMMSKTIQLGSPAVFESFIEFLKEGIIHIFIGYDHILFLLSLLLTSVLVYKNKVYSVEDSFKKTLFSTLKIITAFTLAHSLTLTLSVLGYISMESWMIEAVIALSIVIAAFNNIVVFMYKRLWVFIFIFGLIHGMGFATVLTELGLSTELKVLSLIGFNIGVEVGQVMIILLVVPLLFSIRKWSYYKVVVLQMFSALIILIGLYWLYERVLSGI